MNFAYSARSVSKFCTDKVAPGMNHHDVGSCTEKLPLRQLVNCTLKSFENGVVRGCLLYGA